MQTYAIVTIESEKNLNKFINVVSQDNNAVASPEDVFTIDGWTSRKLLRNIRNRGHTIPLSSLRSALKRLEKSGQKATIYKSKNPQNFYALVIYKPDNMVNTRQEMTMWIRETLL